MNLIEFRKVVGLVAKEAKEVVDKAVSPGEVACIEVGSQAVEQTALALQHAAANLQESAPTAGWDELLDLASRRLGRAQGQKKASQVARLAIRPVKALMQAGLFKRPEDIAKVIDEWGVDMAVQHAMALMPTWRVIKRLQKAELLPRDLRVEAEKFTRGLFGKVESGAEATLRLVGWLVGTELTKDQVVGVMEALRAWEAGETEAKPSWPVVPRWPRVQVPPRLRKQQVQRQAPVPRTREREVA